MMMMIMDMYFYWGTDVVYLFEAFTIKSNPGLYVVALLASFFMALVVEFLQTRKPESSILVALIYALQMLLSYTLMLVLMTFNGGLFLSIVIGYTVGYALFGFAPIEFKQKGQGGSMQIQHPSN